MYKLISLGDESDNKKIISRLRKRVVNDINNIRKVNMIENYNIVLEGNVLKCISVKGEKFNLVKSNEWINEKKLSSNFIKRNMSLIV